VQLARDGVPAVEGRAGQLDNGGQSARLMA
jgi:hypothetical protein